MKVPHPERGIALLITLLIMTVLLGVSASLLNVTLKQFQFSAIGLSSEMAFQAANAGMECFLYQDYMLYPDSRFDVNGDGTAVPPEAGVTCAGEVSNDLVNGGNDVMSGEEQRFRYTWGDPTLCTDVSIYKYYEIGTIDGDSVGPDMSASLGRAGNCPEDVVCTVVRSRGYNVACPAGSDPFPLRTIEREITQRY